MVKKGQLILELRDIDPAALERLQQQCQAYEEKLASAQLIAQAYQAKLQAVTDAQQMAIAAAHQEVAMAEQKVAAQHRGWSPPRQPARRWPTLNAKRVWPRIN